MNLMVEACGLWFEGNREFLRVMAPHPILLRAHFPDNGLGAAEMLFREDYFSSVTRVRRGRLYQKVEHAPRMWRALNVSWAPYNDIGARTSSEFYANQVYEASPTNCRLGQSVALGDSGEQSYWQVALSERTQDAHYVTLKSKTYFGVLPEVNWEAIPEANRQDIQQALDAVVEAAPTQVPQPVIDACRNAACHMIAARFPGSNPKGGKDLAQLASWLEQEGHRKKKARKADAEATDALIELPDSYTSYVVNELHRRAKANAVAARCTRPASQQDANLAVDAIAFLLQDFGWAEAGI